MFQFHGVCVCLSWEWWFVVLMDMFTYLDTPYLI
jgi:hypothetical protein